MDKDDCLVFTMPTGFFGELGYVIAKLGGKNLVVFAMSHMVGTLLVNDERTL